MQKNAPFIKGLEKHDCDQKIVQQMHIKSKDCRKIWTSSIDHGKNKFCQKNHGKNENFMLKDL